MAKRRKLKARTTVVSQAVHGDQLAGSFQRISRVAVVAGVSFFVLLSWFILTGTVPSLREYADRLTNLPPAVLGVGTVIWMAFYMYCMFRLAHLASPPYLVRLANEPIERRRHERWMFLSTSVSIGLNLVIIFYSLGLFEGPAINASDWLKVNAQVVEGVITIIVGLLLGVLANAIWDFLKWIFGRNRQSARSEPRR